MSASNLVQVFCLSFLYYLTVGSGTISISLSLKRYLSKLMNGRFSNNIFRSLKCLLPLSMIAKNCLQKSLVLLKPRHEQLQNVPLSPKETLYFNFYHLYQDHRSKLQKIHLFALLQNHQGGNSLSSFQ